jgi:hypothetical protein
MQAVAAHWKAAVLSSRVAMNANGSSAVGSEIRVCGPFATKKLPL